MLYFIYGKVVMMWFLFFKYKISRQWHWQWDLSVIMSLHSLLFYCIVSNVTKLTSASLLLPVSWAMSPSSSCIPPSGYLHLLNKLGQTNYRRLILFLFCPRSFLFCFCITGRLDQNWHLTTFSTFKIILSKICTSWLWFVMSAYSYKSTSLLILTIHFLSNCREHKPTL